MKAAITLFFCTMVNYGAFAQRTCATVDYVKHQLQVNPALAASYQQVEAHIRRVSGTLTESPQRDTIANEVIMIPVVVHLLHRNGAENISDAQIKSQIDVLNRDYRMLNIESSLVPAVFKGLRSDCRIQFCLAQVDPKDRRTTGIVRKYTNRDYFFADDGMKFSSQGGDNAWDTKRYLNIWVCNIFGRVLGYGTPPGGPADKDGVVIMYDVFGVTGNLRVPFNKGRTTTHEVAHWLGLKHLWGDDLCGDDSVDDTPRQKSYNYGCPAFPQATNCSVNANGDLFMNFMDYTNDACMVMFTTGQKLRMRALFATGGPRNNFLVSYGCDSSMAQGGPLPDSTPVAAVQQPPVRVYPNPVVSQVTVSCKDASRLSGQTIRLFTMQGTEIRRWVLTGGTNELRMTGLAAGCYLLRIDSETDKKTFSIMKL